ncbi:heparan-alpha-glucosaminide N-acetyltransferase domain-containing protein [Demequina pelophila]|uniref:heparan-alpha-glucosaminide N-acetyltransferase domain-containing protein n=1 Tax=Demequina pelophila TaxID=1638984 RepID=UPI00078130DA|nr:heparan-alpha-glucosaminide N-acetyltransferase domain-containing protein [Demequina pelophila]
MTPATRRLAGLDLARGLAVAGMVVAHTADEEAWPLLEHAHGHPSALFAVLAGVTISLMLGGRGGPGDPVAVRHTRIRVAVRAAVLIAMGLMLDAALPVIAVILHHLGLMMLLALAFLRWRAWGLATAGATCLVLGSTVVAAIRPEAPWDALPLAEALWSTRYPVVSWLGYVLIGMTVGRLDLRRGSTLAGLAGAGAGAVAAGLAASAVLDPRWGSIAAHAYTPAEMTVNVGVAMLVIAATGALAPLARSWLSPVAALGAMALTAYVAHLLVIAAVGPEMVREPSTVAGAVLLVVLLASAWAWRRWRGQGPLERGLTVMSSAAADGDLAAREWARQ